MKYFTGCVIILCLSLTSPAQTVNLDSGLVAHYPFNGNPNDKSGNHHDATNLGATLTADRFGKLNSAYHFNGRSTIYVGHDTAFSFQREYTFSFWTRLTDPSRNQKIVAKSKAESYGYPGYIFGVVDNHMYPETYDFTGRNHTFVSEESFEANTWVHMAITYSVGGHMFSYLNGTMIKDIPTTANVIGTNDLPLYIGSWSYVKEMLFNNYYAVVGDIDDIRIYNRVLDGFEIRKLLFEGTASTILLHSPNSGERFLAGAVQKIRWTTLSPIPVSIDYSIDGGTSWRRIASDVGAGIGEYDWIVPNTLSTQCKMKITNASNTSEFVVSEVFTITTGRLGNSWKQANSPITSTLYCVSVVDDSVAWAGGEGGTILLTTNAGVLWDAATKLGFNIYCITGIDRHTAFAGSQGGNTTSIVKTTDGGITWNTLFSQAGGFIDNIIMFDSQNGFAHGDPVNGIWTFLKTSDGGLTWNSVPPVTAIPGEMGYNTAASVVGNTIWFSTNARKVYKSTDRGDSWTSYETLDWDMWCIAFSDSLHGIVGTRYGDTNYSSDGGATWRYVLTGGSSYTTCAVSTDPKTFYLSSGNEIFKSTDAGLKWQLNGESPSFLRNLSFSPSRRFGVAVGTNGTILKYQEETQLPTLKLVSPNGGEHVTPRSLVTITWDAHLCNAVRLEYSTDNGKNWSLIGASWGTAYRSPDKKSYSIQQSALSIPTGAYNWRVPSIESDSVRVRISDSLDASIFDVSDGLISVGFKGEVHRVRYAVDLSSRYSLWGLYGIEYVGDTFIISEWNSSNGHLNIFDNNGSFLESFGIAGLSSGLLDLAWDGQYLYGGDFSGRVYKIDLQKRAVVDTLPIPAFYKRRVSRTGYVPDSSITGLAYDPTRDAFWMAWWYSDIICLNRQSQIISRISADTVQLREGIAGIACDDETPGGPYLWVFTGGHTTAPKYFYKIDTVGRHLDSIDVLANLPLEETVAGGCFLGKEAKRGTPFVGGILQGNLNYIVGLELSTTTSERIQNEIPSSFALLQNYPNPFNATTHFQFSIAEMTIVTLQIHDILGREVATLVNEQKPPGKYSVAWDASRMSSGIYFYTIRAGDFRETKRMVLLK